MTSMTTTSLRKNQQKCCRMVYRCLSGDCFNAQIPFRRRLPWCSFSMMILRTKKKTSFAVGKKIIAECLTNSQAYLLLAQVNKSLPASAGVLSLPAEARPGRAGTSCQIWRRLAAEAVATCLAPVELQVAKGPRVRLGGSRPLHTGRQRGSKLSMKRKALGIFHGHGTKSCCWGRYTLLRCGWHG